MKTKKFLILFVLVIMISMFFSSYSYSYSITEDYKESQKVAEEFLTTKGYELPNGDTVRYLDESYKQLYEVAYEFLNNSGYRIPKGYSIKYLEESKKQLEVVKDEADLEIRVTFNILEGKLEIENIELYRNEVGKTFGDICIEIFTIICFIIIAAGMLYATSCI